MSNHFLQRRTQATLAFVVFLFIYAQAASFNVGCYNIRLKSTSDTGDMNWANRKEYVGKTITTYAYDVIGLNEVVAGTQETDIKALLPGYAFVSWGNSSASVSNLGRLNLIAYKSDKFEMVEEGHFFLGPYPEKSLQSWDTSSLSNKRLTVWAKFKVKDTDEIFYYFITHLDQLGSDARNEGTRLNMEMVRKISGNYPAIICGDHNSSSIRYPFYDLCRSFMDDSRFATATPFPWTYDGTICKWDPNNLNVTRLDYIWVKGIDVNTYNHINDTFGRELTPSDHLAIIANVTFRPYVAEHSRYVDANAAVGGDGSKALPYNTIQAAIDNTSVGDTIYVAAGTYSLEEKSKIAGRKATLSITHSANIYGGYDSDFENVIGRSILTGDLAGNDEVKDGVYTGNEENVYNIMTINKNCAVELSNFEIVGGNASDTNTTGAGIMMNGSRLIINNSIIRDNQSAGNGAGIYAAEQLECNDCQFIRNISAASGGAYFTVYNGVELWWRYSMTRCLFDSNKALQGAAGYHQGFSWAYFGYNTYINNVGINNGAIVLAGTRIVSKVMLVNNTFANNRLITNSGVINNTYGGAALDVALNKTATISLVNNTIVGNSAESYTNGELTADFIGAAINIHSGTPYFFNNIIAGNSSTATTGGDIYNEGETANTAYNVYSCVENMNITPSTTDIIATSMTESVSALSAMLDGKVENGAFIPTLAMNGGTVNTIKVIKPTYGSSPINILPTSQFDEKLLKGDVDNNQELRTALTNDQRGELRYTDGKSSIGAYEYGISGVNTINGNEKELVKLTNNKTTLFINTPKAINGVKIFNLSGATMINIGNVTEGTTAYDISKLPSGVYLVSAGGLSFKIIK